MKPCFLLFWLSFLSISTNAQTTDTLTVITEIDSLIEQNRNLLDDGNFDEALKIIQVAESKAKSIFGTEHEVYARSISALGITHFQLGKIPLAASLLYEAKKVQKETVGEKHPDYAKTLSKLAQVYCVFGNFNEAEILYLEVVKINEELHGKEHLDYAMSLVNLGGFYSQINKYKKSEPLLIEAKKIQEKVSGKKHEDYIVTLIELAALYSSLKKHEKAEIFYHEALELTTMLFGKEHYNMAIVLFPLAILYQDIYKYEKAEILYNQVSKISQNTFGIDHVANSAWMSASADLQLELGNFEQAERLLIEALKIIEKEMGKKNIMYVEILNGLGQLHFDIGNYEKSKELFLDSKEILASTVGIKSSSYGNITSNLSQVLVRLGNYEQAKKLGSESLKICEENYGKNHSCYAKGLITLTTIEFLLEDYEKAEKLTLKSIDIIEKEQGKLSLDFAKFTANLARIFLKMERLSEAESLLIQVRDILENLFERKHPLYNESNLLLGMIYSYSRNYEKAELFYTSFYNNLKVKIKEAQTFLSQNELEKLMIQNSEHVSLLQSFAKEIQTPEYQNIQYQLALLTKGMQLQVDQSTINFILQSRDSVAYENHLNLLGIHRHLAKQYELPISERKNIEKLESQKEILEKQLARQSAVFRKEQVSSNITYKEIKDVLQQGEASIEFVQYQYQNPDPTDSIMYAAVVLLPNQSDATFIPLFEEKQLNTTLANPSNRKLDYVNSLYTFSIRGLVPGKSKESLYNLIWEPLDSILQGIHTVYYSPSGLLNRLTIGAIPVSEEKILQDKYKLVQLSSTRLLALQDEQNYANKKAVLYGNIEYNYDSTAIAMSTKGITDSKMDNKIFEYADRSLRGDNWGKLKWTKKETKKIQKLLDAKGFKTTVLENSIATEESFKQMGMQGESPQVIHLATHGFFFPDPIDTLKQQLVDEPKFKMSEHPMIRSGLIMAGANRVWEGATPITGQDDGILTAYEISQLNLTTTELVVLSACETGLGDIKGNEGVYGLQRAFKMAGVKYLVISLWQVPDFQTQQLMTTFYKKWLEDKMNIPDAFQAAQTEMREMYEDPYFWAGFVLME